MRARILVFLIIAALLPVADAFSQYPGRGGYDRGRGGPGYGDHGRGGGPGGPSYGRPAPGMPPGQPQPGGPRPGQPQPGQPQPIQPQPGGPRPTPGQPAGSAANAEAYARERADRMEGYLRSFDKNGDGTIHPGEVTDERQKRMLGYISQRYGFEAGKPIQLSKLRESMTKSSSPQSKGEPSKGGKPQEQDNQPPLVPGFGVSQESESAAIPHFGQRVGSQVIASATPAAPGAKPPAQPVKQPARPVDEKEKVRNFANTVLRKYDKNNNGRLDRNEWEGVKPDPQTADRDRNNVVTLDELTAALTDYSKGRVRDDDWAAFNPYRAMTPWERLPEELPNRDGFMALDANGDGQVAMAEFTTSWDDTQASEFDFKDRNGDGRITPREWITADAIPEEERLASAAPVAMPQGPSALTRGGPSGPSRYAPPSASASSPRGPSPEEGSAKPAAEAEAKPAAKQWWE